MIIFLVFYLIKKSGQKNRLSRLSGQTRKQKRRINPSMILLTKGGISRLCTFPFSVLLYILSLLHVYQYIRPPINGRQGYIRHSGIKNQGIIHMLINGSRLVGQGKKKGNSSTVETAANSCMRKDMANCTERTCTYGNSYNPKLWGL